jgi:hypothetical protein
VESRLPRPAIAADLEPGEQLAGLRDAVLELDTEHHAVHLSELEADRERDASIAAQIGPACAVPRRLVPKSP